MIAVTIDPNRTAQARRGALRALYRQVWTATFMRKP